MTENQYPYTRSGLVSDYGFRHGFVQGTNGSEWPLCPACLAQEGLEYVVRWHGPPPGSLTFHHLGAARTYLGTVRGVHRFTRAWDIGQRHLLPQRGDPRRE